jgi:predicted permease
LVSDRGEEDFGNLVNNLFWPMMIFQSICTRLTPADISGNLLLPLLSVYTVFVGFTVGLILVRALRLDGDERKIFLFQSCFNNFSGMALPLVLAFLPEKGAGMLFISNLGFIVMMWSLGIILLKGQVKLREILVHLASPGLLMTLASILLVVSGLNRQVPALVYETAGTLGAPTVAVSMMLVGTRIYRLGRHALVFNRWNISLGLLRLVAVPALIVASGVLLRRFGHLDNDSLFIFLLVGMMPASLSSVSLAMAYKSSPDLAAQSIVFSHVFSLATITLFLVPVQIWLGA